MEDFPEDPPPELIEVGTHLKIRIACVSEEGPIGECPWAQVVGARHSGRVLARIDNELIMSDIHGYQLHDIVELEKIWLDPRYEAIWQVVGMIQSAEDLLNPNDAYVAEDDEETEEDNLLT